MGKCPSRLWKNPMRGNEPDLHNTPSSPCWQKLSCTNRRFVGKDAGNMLGPSLVLHVANAGCLRFNRLNLWLADLNNPRQAGCKAASACAGNAYIPSLRSGISPAPATKFAFPPPLSLPSHIGTRGNASGHSSFHASPAPGQVGWSGPEPICCSRGIRQVRTTLPAPPNKHGSCLASVVALPMSFADAPQTKVAKIHVVSCSLDQATATGFNGRLWANELESPVTAGIPRSQSNSIDQAAVTQKKALLELVPGGPKNKLSRRRKNRSVPAPRMPKKTPKRLQNDSKSTQKH